MEVLFDRVAGLDVGKVTLTVCLRTPGPSGRRRAETRTFKTTTGSLRVMRDWLVEAGVQIAAMESTSTYWKPPFYCLAEACWRWRPDVQPNSREVKVHRQLTGLRREPTHQPRLLILTPWLAP